MSETTREHNVGDVWLRTSPIDRSVVTGKFASGGWLRRVR